MLYIRCIMKSYHSIAIAILLSGLIASLASCKDEVDESDLFTFTGETAYSYLQNNEDFTDFAYILSRVKLSKRSQSTISELLSARGNYTVFAPTNEAIEHFLDSVYETKNFDLTQIPDSMAEAIAKNSLIDHKEQPSYLSTTFVTGALGKTNMNSRYIQIDYDNAPDGSLITLVNLRSRIITPDIEVINGVIHTIDHVIDMSASTLPDLIKQTENTRIFGKLLELTGWDDSMLLYIDQAYEEYHAPMGNIDKGGGYAEGEMGPTPEHHFYGYTAFVEPDSIFVEKWGIPAPIIVNGNVQNYDEIIAACTEKCKEVYPNATDEDLTSTRNAVNQFVSYHLLPERIIYNLLVVHKTEMGYAWKSPDILSINAWEYYETMGYPRRIIKITEGAQTKGKRINRHSTYNNGFFDKYDEASCDRPGIKILENNGGLVSNALNGFYYTLDDILVYDEDVPNKVLNERMRYDFTAICPDLMTNGIRQMDQNDPWIPILPGYLKNWWYNEDTYWRYAPYYSTSIANYQCDEINILGQYDFIFRLPPVPYDGTWEFRICAPEISHFGMFQVYLGTDRNNLMPIGLPLDFRLPSSNPKIGWVMDTNDIDYNREVDKTMRNHGYMKNTMHDGPTSGSAVNVSMRAQNGDYIRLRKIIYNGRMTPEETYYVRIKSVLENTRTCCMLDFFELVPKSVYGGEEMEDPW